MCRRKKKEKERRRGYGKVRTEQDDGEEGGTNRREEGMPSIHVEGKGELREICFNRN